MVIYHKHNYKKQQQNCIFNPDSARLHWVQPDEIIFRTVKVRNRLMLELMARGGMRIGDVLKLRLRYLQDRKLLIRERKSGREHENSVYPTEGGRQAS